LFPDANPKQGPRPSELQQGIEQTSLAQMRHTIWHRALARKHRTVRAGNRGSILSDHNALTGRYMLKRLEDRAQITHSIVDYRNRAHRITLCVLGPSGLQTALGRWHGVDRARVKLNGHP
jgi:hypothetical protein